MAGHCIAMLRILCLKAALQATVTSPEFQELRAFEDIARVLLKEEFWTCLYLMCRALCAPMRVLRLADQKVAAMDKLHYFLCQANVMLPRYLQEAEHHSTNLLSDGIRKVIEDTTDLASETVEKEAGTDKSEVECDINDDDKEEASNDDDDAEVSAATIGHGATVNGFYSFVAGTSNRALFQILLQRMMPFPPNGQVIM